MHVTRFLSKRYFHDECLMIRYYSSKWGEPDDKPGIPSQMDSRSMRESAVGLKIKGFDNEQSSSSFLIDHHHETVRAYRLLPFHLRHYCCRKQWLAWSSTRHHPNSSDSRADQYKTVGKLSSEATTTEIIHTQRFLRDLCQTTWNDVRVHPYRTAAVQGPIRRQVLHTTHSRNLAVFAPDGRRLCSVRG